MIGNLKNLTSGLKNTTRLRKALLATCLIGMFSLGLNSPASAAERFSGRSNYRNSNQRICLSWSDQKRQNIVMQTYDYSCGAAALATLFTYYWRDGTGEQDILIDLGNMLRPEDLLEREQNGLALTDLKNIAKQRGYRAQMGKLDSASKLRSVKVPVIVSISPKGFDHFVVIRKVIGNKIYLADPIRGNINMTLSEFSKVWIENALLVVLDKDLDQSKNSRLHVRSYEVNPQYSNTQAIRRQYIQGTP